MRKIALDNVESRQAYSFPDSSTADTSSSGGNLGAKVQGVLSQLSNTVQNTQGGLDQVEKDLQSTKSSIGSFGTDLSKTYFIALSSIGVGLAGIIIVPFLFRERQRFNDNEAKGLQILKLIIEKIDR